MSPFTDAELARLDRHAEKREHDASFYAAHPELYDAGLDPLIASVFATHAAVPAVASSLAERRAVSYPPVITRNAAWEELRETLNKAERRALNRQFTDQPLTGFGELQEDAAA